jgi:hypothetical protein
MHWTFSAWARGLRSASFNILDYRRHLRIGILHESGFKRTFQSDIVHASPHNDSTPSHVSASLAVPRSKPEVSMEKDDIVERLQQRLDEITADQNVIRVTLQQLILSFVEETGPAIAESLKAQVLYTIDYMTSGHDPSERVAGEGQTRLTRMRAESFFHEIDQAIDQEIGID